LHPQRLCRAADKGFSWLPLHASDWGHLCTLRCVEYTAGRLGGRAAALRFISGDAPANGGNWSFNWTVGRRWHSACLHGTHPLLLDSKMMPYRTAAQVYLVCFVNSEHEDLWVYRTCIELFDKDTVAMFEGARRVGLSQRESLLYQVYQQLHRVASVLQRRYTERRMQLVSQLQLQLQTAWDLLSQTPSQSRAPRQLAAYLHSPPPHDLTAQLNIARQLDLFGAA
jgi:hypothetical protein